MADWQAALLDIVIARNNWDKKRSTQLPYQDHGPAWNNPLDQQQRQCQRRVTTTTRETTTITTTTKTRKKHLFREQRAAYHHYQLTQNGKLLHLPLQLLPPVPHQLHARAQLGFAPPATGLVNICEDPSNQGVYLH